MTLDKRSDGSYLLRLEHLYGAGEDPELSRPAMVNLRQVLFLISYFYFQNLSKLNEIQSFFDGFSITSVEETTLGGNQLKKDSQRFFWKEVNELQKKNSSETSTVVDIENIVLHPMQIRTFIIKIQKKSKPYPR